MKPCPTCQQLIPETALFCPNDGTSLTTVENDPLLGTVIAERYMLKERVGEGRSGIIYRAEHVALRTRLAVKLLHHPLSQDEEAVDRFREEATRLAQIESEHIVRVSDFGRAADERLFFAMEYLEGESLAAAIGRDGKLGEADAVELLEQIGDAVADAHEIGIVHGDLRPRNIFLTRRKKRRVVKLLDFGLTKLSGNSAKPSDKSAMADPRYMAPEQARGGAATDKSDIYALGIIAYEMFTGAPPFVGAGTFDVLTKHLEAKPVPVGTKAPGVSERVANAVDRSLAKQPAQRFASIAAFIGALTGEEPEEPAVAAPIPEAQRPTLRDSSPSITAALERTAAAEHAMPVAKGKSSEVAAAKPAEPAAAKPEAKAAAKTTSSEVAAAKPAEPAAAKPEAKAAAKPASGEAAAVKPEPKASEAKAKAGQAAAVEPEPKAAEAKVKAGEAAAVKPEAARTVLGMGISAADVKAAAGVRVAASGAGEQPKVAEQAVIVGRGVEQIDPSTYSAETIVPRSDGRPQPQPAQAPAGAPPAGGERKSTPPFSETDPLGQSSMNWFAEGVAAEQELKTRTKSGPLPALYDGDDDEELPTSRFSASAVIGLVVVGAALVIGLILLLNREPHPTARKPVAVAAKPDTQAATAQLDTARTEDSTAAPATAPDAAAPTTKVALPPDAAPPKPEPPKPAVAVKQPKKPEPRRTPPRKPTPPRRTEPQKPQPKRAAAAKPSLKDAAQASVHLEQGRSYLRRGQHAKARAEFNRALKLKPSAAAHAGLGEVAFEEGFYALAAKHLRKALRMQPSNTRNMVMLGHAYFKTNKLKEAISQYRKALKRNPNHSEARSGMQAAIRRLAGN